MAARAEIHVVAGALHDAEGRVLIAKRPRGRHMAGRWEFPGGKLEGGESPLAGLKRELAEELGVELRTARPLIRLRHEYPDRRVLLDVWQVTDYQGEPRALEADALAWARPDDLPNHDLIEADRPIVTALRLPRVAIALEADKILKPVRGSATLAFFVPAPADGLKREAVAAVRASGHRVFVAGEDMDALRSAALSQCDGVVLRWRGQSLHVDRSGTFLVGVHCEDAGSATQAVAEGAHFLVLAPDAGPLPKDEVERICAGVSSPVFAGWYEDARQLEKLQQAGAHGCAIRRMRR